MPTLPIVEDFDVLVHVDARFDACAPSRSIDELIFNVLKKLSATALS